MTHVNKVLHLFVNQDLRCGHEGLAKVAAKEKVDVTALRLGEFALFANRSLTGMKIFAANNTVIYCKAPENRPFDINAVRYLPRFITGQTINYDAALLETFRTEYKHLFKSKIHE